MDPLLFRKIQTIFNVIVIAWIVVHGLIHKREAEK